MLLIKDRITISKAKKNKCLGYEFVINHKNTQKNVVIARSYNGKSRGIKGFVTKDGYFTLSGVLEPHITSKIKQKIEFALEMVYGKDGSKDPVIVGKYLKIITSECNEKKLFEFNK